VRRGHAVACRHPGPRTYARDCENRRVASAAGAVAPLRKKSHISVGTRCGTFYAFSTFLQRRYWGRCKRPAADSRKKMPQRTKALKLSSQPGPSSLQPAPPAWLKPRRTTSRRRGIGGRDPARVCLDARRSRRQSLRRDTDRRKGADRTASKPAAFPLRLPGDLCIAQFALDGALFFKG
jgi:hypothetical protein